MTTGTTDRLAQIVEVKRHEVKALAPREADLELAALAAPPTRGFGAALRSPTEVRLLAEIKNRSPSAGAIREGADPVEVARAYERGGAAALSVLTDVQFFGGSLEALKRVRTAVDLPLLRKDFIIDAVQVYEARAAGADAILLIVRILEDRQLITLYKLARSLGMDVLVEIHDLKELVRVVELSEFDEGRKSGNALIGVNNRDLSTFTTDLGLSFRMAQLPYNNGVTLVAESGIKTPEDVRRLGEAGVDAILVGESLMRQSDLEAAARALAGHPKAAVRARQAL